jgi:hypothetical protein
MDVINRQSDFTDISTDDKLTLLETREFCSLEPTPSNYVTPQRTIKPSWVQMGEKFDTFYIRHQDSAANVTYDVN